MPKEFPAERESQPVTAELRSPSALIFDMDGVLVDSEPLHKRAKEEAFQRFGIVVPESVYDSYKGRPDEIDAAGNSRRERQLRKPG